MTKPIKKFKILPSVWFEPTDHTIAWKPLQIAGSQPLLHYCSPNFKEIQKMAEFVTKTPAANTTLENPNEMITEARDLALNVVRIIPNIMVTLGKYGLLVSARTNYRLELNFNLHYTIENVGIHD